MNTCRKIRAKALKILALITCVDVRYIYGIYIVVDMYAVIYITTSSSSSSNMKHYSNIRIMAEVIIPCGREMIYP